MDAGILQSLGQAVVAPMPLSWMKLPSAPPDLPRWANIGKLSSTQVRALAAQIGYDQSSWNYNLVGSANQLGRYQFSTTILEDYGLLHTGSNKSYGTNCVNYQHCWTQGVQITPILNSYNAYIYNTTNITTFLQTPSAQEHLAFQHISTLYENLLKINAIQESDSVDIIGGMISVAWLLGAGSAISNDAPTGMGAFQWRYSGLELNLGSGVVAFNKGRYAVKVLAQ